jgi:hypothetical protein
MIDTSNKKYGFRDNVLWISLLTFMLIALGEIMSLLFTVRIYNPDYSETFNLYFPFWAIWLSFMLAIVLIKKNRYILDKIKYKNGGNTFKNLLIGFGIGFLMNGTCALTAYLHGDIKLRFDKFEFFPILLMFIVVFIQSSAEELACRGFMYQRIAYRYKHPWTPTIITAVFFMAIHLGNDHISLMPILDLFMSGLVFGAMILYFDSIWMAMGCHTTWNFTQNILLGLPNSGSVSSYSIFVLDRNSARGSFAYDVGFGLEGSIMSIVVQVISLALMIYVYRKYAKNQDVLK